LKRSGLNYSPVIGLEIHAQLSTESKMFAADAVQFGSEPNTQISVITLGHPGILPKANRKAIEYGIKMGLACNGKINRFMIFDRKNYFYPDLPKGYQITQDKTPVCVGGNVEIRNSKGETRAVRLNRIHIEEDAGKSIHQEGDDTLVDLNRAGVPLIEIVTEPDIHSSEEAGLLLAEIRKIVQYLEICDGNMEEGSLRCDANVSVRRKDEMKLGRKVEIKNMNSIRNVQKAIDYEIQRQIKILEAGKPILSETRTFDAETGKTFGMRTKEELNDYRYFPDPDLSPVTISEEWMEEIRQNMPILPGQLLLKLVQDYGLPEYDACLLTETKELADYFLVTCQYSKNYKSVSNWIMGPVKSYLNDTNTRIADFPVSPEKLGKLIQYIDQKIISHDTAAKQVFPELLKDPNLGIDSFIKEKGFDQAIGSEDIEKLISEVLASYPDKVAEYKKGKKGLLGLFVGEVMKKTKGKADPKKTNTLIQEALK
jgi:aspartyl-tRNA(Asn)/glutamyl-tRNA(Gln) amidotransferase subunit B